MLPSDIRSIHQAYSSIYEEIDLVTDELVEEVVEELIQECLEFGYEIDEAADVVEEAAIEYLMELNPYAAAGSKEARAYQKSTTATKRGEERKAAVSAAKEKVKAKVKGAVAGAGIAASIAKDEARRAGRKATHAVSSAVQKKKAEVKSGVKGLLGKGLRKAAGAVGKVAQKAAGAASRLGEEVEQLDEISDRLATAARNTRQRRFDRSVARADTYADAGYQKQKSKTDRLNQTLASREQRTGSKIKAVEEFDVEQVDTWDVVLEYLITNGHADTNAEALYVMSQLDEEMIHSILEDSATLSAAARKRAEELGRKRRSTKEYKQGLNRGTRGNERAAYNLSNIQRTHAANPSTQVTRSKKPAGYDTGAHKGDYGRFNRSKPENNPKHNANK